MKTLRTLALALSVILLLPSCYKKQELDYSRWYTVQEEEDPTETLQGLMIMSSNVRFYSARYKTEDPDVGERDWENRKVGYFKMINTMRPQVVGLQEAEMNQVSDIINNCSGYAYIGVGRTDGDKKGESTSILYRTAEINVESWGTVWLSPTPDVPGSCFPEMTDGQCRTSTWAVMTDKVSGRKFFHINSHTSLVRESQIKELQVILNTIAAKCPSGLPVVLTADWNLEQDDDILKAIGDAYSNARRTAPITDDAETFHWWGNRKTIQKHSQLDHVFYGGFDKLLKFRTLTMQWEGFWISDHHPVYAIFELEAGGEVHPKPVVDFDLPASPVMDALLTFTDRSRAEGGIASWSWNIGGFLSTEQNPSVVFSTCGDDIPVTLTITDNYGQKASLTKTMSVTSDPAHNMSIVWSQNYDDGEGAYVYWTSPALNATGDRIYVTSTGNHLVCFDNNGNQIGSYDIGEYGPVHGTGDYPMSHCCPTPSVDNDGNVYIPVQYGYDATNGHGGFYSIKPGCSGVNWYVNTGAKSQYEYMIPAIFDDKVAVLLRGGDGADSEWKGNMVVMKRSDHSIVEQLQPDGGSYGGMAVAADRKIAFSANKLTSDLNLGTGYKVGIPEGSGWRTSESNNAGKRANLLSGDDMTPKGCQPAIAKDGTIYLCSGTNSGGELVCARYDLNTYDIVPNTFPKAIWKVRIPATVARNGYGCVLDEQGNAYYMSGKSIFRLNKDDGHKEWEVALTDGASGNCGVAAIDQLGYLYVCDLNGNRLLKLSSANGQIISELSLGGRPRSCPTIAKDGSIYLTVNKGGPSLFKISCEKTTGPGSNWSQLGANQQKTCVAPTDN